MRVMFQSTPSGGKATHQDDAPDDQPRPFQSTPSGGKATKQGHREPHKREFQSTPSGGKATL